MPQTRTDKFHGYVNNLAVLDSGKTVKILGGDCLLYTSPSPRDGLLSRMPSSA